MKVKNLKNEWKKLKTENLRTELVALMLVFWATLLFSKSKLIGGQMSETIYSDSYYTLFLQIYHYN